MMTNCIEDDYDYIQPSLLRQLANVLEQYPDDGQILKVWNEHSYLSPYISATSSLIFTAEIIMS